MEALARQVEAHPDFRVVRRFDPARAGAPLTGSAVRRGVVVDTETTGTDLEADQVIELALVAFEYDEASGAIGRVLGSYSALEDPGRDIPPASTAIHHITDEMVAGQRIDDAAVASLLDGVSIVVAHNAGFDRRFLERRLSVFESLPWACSFYEVPWAEHDLSSAKLEYLAYRAGFFYEGHRAEIDCRALLEVLRQPLGKTGASAFKTLLARSAEPTCRLWATKSPFETKDVLRARGFRWDPNARCWWKELPKSQLFAETVWLKAAVYGGTPAIVDVDYLDAKVRFSERDGDRKKVKL